MLRLFILFLLISCGKSGNSPVEKTIYYSYGSEQLPGILPELDSSYRPLNLSKKIFVKDNKNHVPFDFLEQDLVLEFNTALSMVTGHSKIRFSLTERGFPFFELKAPVSSIVLDGTLLQVISVTDPDSQNEYWSLSSELEPGNYEVLIQYQLPADRTTFNGGQISFLTNMTDLNGKFFEHWGPVGFEDDAFKLNLNLKIEGTEDKHRLISNGSITMDDPTSWKVIYEEFYTKSSFYIHLFPENSFIVKTFNLRDIPVTVYGQSESLVNNAIETLPSLFNEFETDFGLYPHKSFISHMKSTGGGMEYVGATITSLSSLDHELFHSWFARSVMPADGRSGWIDEAFASWRDYGYFQAPGILQRSFTNLANYSPFRKTTPRNSYVDGRNLISELDREFAHFGGMKILMREFYQRYKNRIVTTEEFQNFLNEMTGINVDPLFERYAMGR